MRIDVLIDGYNFLRARTSVRLTSGPGNLQRAREALLRWLAERCPDHQSLMVVFDAARSDIPFSEPAEQIRYGVRVRFAHHYPDADSLIAELIASHHSPKQLLVVSNDRAVQRSARKRKAQPIGCEAFEAYLLAHAKPTPAAREAAAKDRIPSADEKDYWLAIFGKEVSQPVEEDLPPGNLPIPPAATVSSPHPVREPASRPPRPSPRTKRQRKESPPGGDRGLTGDKGPVELSSLADFYREMLASEVPKNGGTMSHPEKPRR
jgi:predicted RNA-binding protein with PIN domain